MLSVALLLGILATSPLARSECGGTSSRTVQPSGAGSGLPGAVQRPPIAPILPADLTDDHLRLATAALVERLYAMRNSAGHWERQYPDPAMAHINAHLGGHTALVTLALLMAGESHQNPQLKPAVDYLIAREPDHTYVRSLRAHVFAQLPGRFGPALDRDRSWLIRAYDANAGTWNYTNASFGLGYDNSLTQYGVLGLWEATRQGQEVPKALWERVEQHFLRTQLQDGAWNYRPMPGVDAARGSMVAAGITCLFITDEHLHAAHYATPGAPPTASRAAIDRGLAWLEKNFAADHHPGSPGGLPDSFLFYYLYGIERVGLAGGIKRFGERDWFREGAATIIDRLLEPAVDETTGQPIPGRLQVRREIGSTGADEPALVQMSFALMFLARGRVPVAVSKLEDPALPWDNRPRDVANYVERLSDAVEASLSWQILPVDSVLGDWFDSPMVYLASHEALPWLADHRETVATRTRVRDTRAGRSSSDATRHDTPTTLERLRHYLVSGGLLFSTADGESDAFTTSVVNLGQAMFPDYEWRELPADHWVYRLAEPVSRPPRLLGLSNGVRELMIHAPEGDFGRVLQMHQLDAEPAIAATLANLYFYASERHQPRPRLAHNRLPVGESLDADIPRGPTFDALRPRRDPGSADAGRDGAWVDPLNGRHLTALPEGPDVRAVLRGVYDGNWNPEPVADRVLAARLRDERGLRLIYRDVPLDRLGDAVEGETSGRILLIRGTDAADLPENATAWDAVRLFAEGGGTVVIENVGGVSDFGREAERLARSWWPQSRFRRAGRDQAITGEGLAGGVNLDEVDYRLFSLVELGNLERQPRLRSVDVPRPRSERDLEAVDAEAASKPGRVFVSRDDLSQALLGQPVWGVSGYGADDALSLLGNLIEGVGRP